MNSVLAFDWGTTIVGILDVSTGIYTAYRGANRMVEGAKRIVFAEGTVVSFNGTACDLPKLFELLQLDQARRVVKATHDDMLLITSTIRWPPDPGTSPIYGWGLGAAHAYYCGDCEPTKPRGLKDDYEADNWRDCYRAAELWQKWKRGELAR